MNYGNLGYIREDGALFLEQDILSAFCLNNNSKIYGLYYPSPPESEGEHYKDITIKHDFMLTTIPPRLWPVSCCINIYLLQRRGSMNKICEYLKEKNISIIHAESSRSTHRYATWSLHIAFENLADGRKLNYDKDNTCYFEVQAALKIFLEDINTKLKDVLLKHDYNEPVQGHPNSSLSYFSYYKDEHHSWIMGNDKIFLQPFELKLNNEKKHQMLVSDGDQTFEKILARLKLKEKNLLPATTFSELDARDLNIRTVLISAENSKRFFKLKIEYTRDQIESGVGILHNITDKWLRQFNVWHSYNYIMQNEKTHEEGAMVFLIENVSRFLDNTGINQSDADCRDSDSYINEAKENINNIIKKCNADNAPIQYKSPEIISLPVAGVMEKIFDLELKDRAFRNFTFDLFISYSHVDKNFVDSELLPILDKYDICYFLDEKELEYGQRIDNELFYNITNSREMCVVMSDDSSQSKWVTTEQGAAWILDMMLVPIYLNQEVKKNSIAFMDVRYSFDGSDKRSIERYAKQVINRRNKSEANKFRYHYLK